MPLDNVETRNATHPDTFEIPTRDEERAALRFGDLSKIILTYEDVGEASIIPRAPGTPGDLRSWRTTDNDLKTLATQHNDACLILDELAQVEPRAVGELVYRLARGLGKRRPDRGWTAHSDPAV